MPLTGVPAGPDAELTTTQAAAILGVSASAFGDYLRRGWIQPVRRIGRSKLYRRADVDALHAKLHPHESNHHHPL